MTATIALPRPDWLARLRTIMVLRGGRRVVNIPGGAVSVSRRAVSSGATDWWLAGGAPTPVAVYQPKGAASLSASYTNLANPGTYDAAPGVAPTWSSATGWTFDGLSKYLTTGIVPASGWSAVVRFSNVTSSNDRFLFGSRSASGNNRLGIQPSSNTDTQVAYSSGQFVLVTPALTSGVLGVAGQQGYRNGTADGGAIGAWDRHAEYGIFIGARNLEGVANAFIDAKIQALAIYSATLTADEVAVVSAAMSAL